MNKLIVLALSFFFFTHATSAHDSKKISLSFDDAPRGQGPMFSGLERTEALLKALEEVEAGPAVFFVLTKQLNSTEKHQRIAQYAKAGHLIANHSHTHPWLHKTELEDYLADIDRAETALDGFDNRRDWFRFPYLDEGRSNPLRDQMRDALSKRDLFSAYVTIDNYDWYLESKWKDAVESGKQVDMVALREVYLQILLSATEFYDQLAQEELGRSPIHTLLLHENDLAAMFIDDLVIELKNQGWEIVDPDTAYKDPIANHLPKTMKTGQGRVAALAIDAGADATTLTHLAIEEGLIDRLIEDKEVFSDPQE